MFRLTATPKQPRALRVPGRAGTALRIARVRAAVVVIGRPLATHTAALRCNRNVTFGNAAHPLQPGARWRAGRRKRS